MLREHLIYQETDLSEFKSNSELVIIPKVAGVNTLLLFKQGILKDALAISNGKIVHLNKDIFPKIFAFSILQSSFKCNQKLQELSGTKAIAIEAIVTIKVCSDAKATLIQDILFNKKHLEKADQLQIISYDIYHYKNNNMIPLLPLRVEYASIAALAMLYLPVKDNVGLSGQKFLLTTKLLKKKAKKCLEILQRAYPNINIEALLITENSTKNFQKYFLLKP